MYFEDITLGMTIEIAPAVIEKEKMLDFARTYDNIPLHTDEEYAKTTPFGRLIAPGVMSFMSVWARYLEVDIFGEELIAGKSTKIEWIKPVFAEDVLTGRATVTDCVERNPRNGLVEITIEAYNQHGELVLINVGRSAPDVRFRRRRVGDFASQKQQTQDVTEAIVKRRAQ